MKTVKSEPTETRKPKQPMSQNQYSSLGDVQITEEHINFLRNAGASEELIEVINYSPEPNPKNGLVRNSAREEIKKYIMWGDIDSEKDPQEFSQIGGGCFTQLWNGNLYDAYGRADLNNKDILTTVFGTDKIVEAGVLKGYSIEFVQGNVAR